MSHLSHLRGLEKDLRVIIGFEAIATPLALRSGWCVDVSVFLYQTIQYSKDPHLTLN